MANQATRRDVFKSVERSGPPLPGPCVTIDFTPLSPGGGNGGIKLVARALVEQFHKLAPDWRFRLLTSPGIHDELADLDADNVSRRCLAASPPIPQVAAPRPSKVKNLAKRFARRLPESLRYRLRSYYGRLKHAGDPRQSLPRIEGDLLFCPFAAPPVDWGPSHPVVCVIADLQYRHYGHFFTVDNLRARDQMFLTIARRADRLICISDFTKRTVLETGEVCPDKVETIYVGLSDRLQRSPSKSVDQELAGFGLAGRRYLLYPANYWPHKNHAMLLTALAQFVARNPESDLLLVLTGADTGAAALLKQAVKAMNLSQRVLFLGYVADSELANLMTGCAALIYPSLFEGFGMPPLEAMTLGKPVLCSNVTSLPEVVGDAAILFDPRCPEAIAEAVERFESMTADEVEKMSIRGRKRVEAMGDSVEMAQKYLCAFSRLLNSERQAVDGWPACFMTVGRANLFP